MPLTDDIGFCERQNGADSSTVYYDTPLLHDMDRAIVNLQNFSIWMLRHERSDALFLSLARLPSNGVYKGFFWWTFLSSLRSRLGLSWPGVLRYLAQNLA